jgi:hypothetical protein
MSMKGSPRFGPGMNDDDPLRRPSILLIVTDQQRWDARDVPVAG